MEYAVARTQMPRTERVRREGFAPTRGRYQPVQVREIPVAERRLVYRTIGPRLASARAPAAASARRTESRPTQARRGPRVTVQGGIRIIRGGGRGDTY